VAAKLGLEIGKSGPFESPEQEVLLNCLRTADWLTRAVVDVLKPSGLSTTQYNVLRILRGVSGQGINCQEIGQRMITRDPDLTRLLDRVEKRGLVSRQRPEEDRRIVRTTITQAGLDLLSQLDTPVREVHHRLLGHLGQEKLATLSLLLEQAREQSAV
jgi:MarR family transcriptional regulator, organic hydroperoxide resistance regulator